MATSIRTAQDHPHRLLYSRKLAAQQLSLSVRALDYLIQQQKIATRRIGKKVLVHHTELARFAGATTPIQSASR